jgi:alpha-tubulin suppressor-like RCC1 family protein
MLIVIKIITKICAKENIENYLTENKKTLIITNSVNDGKFPESKYKKYENSSIVFLDSESFEEIVSVYNEIVLKKSNFDKFSSLNKIISENNKKEKTSNNILKNEKDVSKSKKDESNSEKDLVDLTIKELQDFGFDPELIETEILKMKDCFNINDLISNLIEYKEKAKEFDENNLGGIELNVDLLPSYDVMPNPNAIRNNNKSLEEKTGEDEIDTEAKNECFETKEEDKKSSIPEYFEEMDIPEKADKYLIYKIFISINEKISILYTRRILISIVAKLIENLEPINSNDENKITNNNLLELESSENKMSNSKAEKIISLIPEDALIKTLKLLTNEGLFSNTINYGSDLLLQIKEILTKLYTNTKKTKKISEITDKLTSNVYSELEKILNSKLESYDFYTLNEHAILNKPVLFFSIWNLMIMNEYSRNKPEYTYIFNILSGVVMKIKDNKQIRWFLLDLLIQFTNKISISLKTDLELTLNLASEKPIKNIENVNKLRIFFDESIAKEAKKNLSKRSQMICELLIYLEELEAKLKVLAGKSDNNDIANLLEAKIKKDNFIVDLLTTFEMMKDFFDKRYLKYLAWTEMNPEIINSSKLTFESAHLYPKAPHTVLINIPNSISLDVNIFSDTLLDNGDAIVFSLDKNCNYPLECFVNRNSKKQFSIHSSHIFLHFPTNYLNEVYSFGSNSNNRLGHSSTEVYSPKLIDSLSSYIIKDICIGDNFTLVLTNNGELYASGCGLASGLKQKSNTFTKAAEIFNPEKLNSLGISLIGVNQGSTIISTKDSSNFSIGLNTNGQIGQGYTSPVNDITSMLFVKKIKQISISETHTMMMSMDGHAYHIGNNDYYQSGELLTTRNNSPKLLDFGKEFICECVSAGEYFSVFVMKNILTKKTKLYSSGYNLNGRCGTSKDDGVSKQFTIIPCFEFDDTIEFKFCYSNKSCSAAISTCGKLFTWGLNLKGHLGFGHFNSVVEPMKVTYFDKYEVLDASMSSDHMLVLALDAEKNKVSVFGCGDYSSGMLGETITQKTEKKDCIATPIKIGFFEGKNPYKIITGSRASIVMCRVKPYEEIRDKHENAGECALCSNQPIIGNLYAEICSANENTNIDNNDTQSNQISFLSENEVKFYCAECEKINELSSKLPKLLIKAPLHDYTVIRDLAKKSNLLPKTDSSSNSLGTAEDSGLFCKNCKERINIAAEGCYQYSEGKALYALCNCCIDLFPACISSAKVYLRTFTKYKSLEILNTNLYYENSISYGHKFSITPVLNEKGGEAIIEKNLNSFNNFVDEIFNFNKFEIYEQLVDLLNHHAQKSEKSIFLNLPKDLSFKKEELSLRGSLIKSTPDVLRKMFVILKILNTRVKELLPFIDFSKVLQDNQRLSFHFNKITPLIFWETKFEIIKSYLEKTSAEYECAEVKINRMKTRRFIEKGKTDHTGEFTVFGQIYQYIKSKSFKIFKKKEGGNNNKMFNVTFVGEASIDAGGPYREALTQACAELQSAALPLFIPSPNQKNESGLFREKWIINPSAKSTTHLEMFKYFGGLIGYAMRTGEFLNMDLPSIFWKQLLEAILDRKDLEFIDRYTIQCLDDIMNIHKKGVNEKNFGFIVEQKFTTCLSDGSEVELIEGGRNIEVEFANRIRYCELVEKIRLEECKVQIAAIRSGLE